MTRTDLATLADAQGLAGGTSFPGSPAANDLFYRTDRDLLYFYDGTRWLTVNEYMLTIPMIGSDFSAASNVIARLAAGDGTTDWWLEKITAFAFITTTNTGSAYWNIELHKVTTAGVDTMPASVNTSADAANTWLQKSASIGALLGVTHSVLYLYATKTGSPGALRAAANLFYRKVG